MKIRLIVALLFAPSLAAKRVPKPSTGLPLFAAMPALGWNRRSRLVPYCPRWGVLAAMRKAQLSVFPALLGCAHAANGAATKVEIGNGPGTELRDSNGALLLMNIFLLLLMLTGTLAAAISVEWSNDSGTELLDFDGVALSDGMGGILGVGDGAVLRLGYLDRATVANPFLGNWIVLTGGTIGDKGDRGDGRFNLSRSSDNFVPGAPLPAEGTPLAIRFYDAPPGSTPQFFNTVANEQGLWNWQDGFNLRIPMRLSDPGLIWQGGVGSEFRTTIPVPEPSALMLMFVAMIPVRVRSRKAGQAVHFSRHLAVPEPSANRSCCLP